MSFSYRSSLAPMMWAFLSIAVVEGVVVHLLVALWHPWLAIVLSIASLFAIVSIVKAVRSFGRLPVVIDAAGVTMRCGTLGTIRLPISTIAGLRESWTALTIKDRTVLKLSLLSYPNVVVDLAEPMAHGRRRVTAVAHRLDEPEAFCAALRERLA